MKVYKCTNCGEVLEWRIAGKFNPDTHCYDCGPTSWLLVNNEEETGAKFDEDLYEKVDLSLIPWDILSNDYKDSPFHVIAAEVHDVLNNDEPAQIKDIFNNALSMIGVAYLATALGYGKVKYGRNNWKKGFGGDWKRFLKATLRHCHDILQHDQDHDGETIEGYPKGNCHKGAVLFSLMVAMKEVSDDSI